MIIIIKGILFGLIMFLIGYFNRKSSKKGKLFFGKWILFLGAGFLVPIIWILYGVLNGLAEDQSIIFAIIIFAIPSLYCFLEYKKTYGDYNKDYVSFCTPWSGCKKYKWDEIEKITYSENMHWYIIYTNDNKKMRFSSYLAGIDFFIDYAYEKNIKFE